MYTPLRIVFLFSALTATAASSSSSETKIMEVAATDKDSFAALDIVCARATETEFACDVAGTFITTNPAKLHGFQGMSRLMGLPGKEPKNAEKKCFVEVAKSKANFRVSEGHRLIYHEGPGGRCATSQTAVLDLDAGTYELHTESADRSGPFCAAQGPETHRYTVVEFYADSHPIQCSSLESIPTMWLP